MDAAPAPARASRRKRVGVVLFQLGGPDSAEAIEPFLYNLFCDPDILPLGLLGAVLRKPLAKWIAWRRARRVGERYAQIGGHSPIRQLTERQAEKLVAALAPHVDAEVFIAMRYWKPLTAAAADRVRAATLDALVLLPLYPQYSSATTGSSLKEWSRVYRPNRPPLPLHLVEHFYNHPFYIEAVVENAALALGHFDCPDRVHLVFSAHGLPISLIERGDPYQRQVEATVRLARQRARWPNPHSLCYQSKFGRQKWLEPSLLETIRRLASDGTRRVLVIPVSFVTEHIETLHEIDIEAREEARRCGVEQFEMMPALGDSPRFIATLAHLVLRAIAAESVPWRNSCPPPTPGRG